METITDTETRFIEHARLELGDAEARLIALQQRVNWLRSVVEGYPGRSHVAEKQSGQREDAQRGSEPPHEEPSASMREDVAVTGASIRRGSTREAIRDLFREDPHTPRTLVEIQSALESRGQLEGITSPKETIRKATLREVAAGVLTDVHTSTRAKAYLAAV